MTGTELRDNANKILGDYFREYRQAGATCDFGGVAQLVEESRTPSNDDAVYQTDDEYYGVVVNGPSIWVLVVGGIVVAMVGGLFGFVVAMRYNPKFNEKVRKSSFFLPLSSSKNSLIRSSLNLPMLENYDEIQEAIDNERQTFIPTKFS